ncbi:MAG: hypothetical protein C5B60_04455 [Chloroflexi bacterium]|nr:MAG: hypothetical protein C5B60_04455 [Chloroflexota bacterium]
MSNGLIIAPGGGAPGVPQPILMGDGETQAVFPDFTPIVPPPPIGEGGGPPPPFPPPTPPPIGVVPPGILVGPAIAPAGVPPSVAGFVQPQFGTGSATVPPGYFPSFTTVFPVPTIVFTNTMMIGPLASLPNGSPPLPPSTPSTQNIAIGGWAPQRPPWLFSAELEPRAGVPPRGAPSTPSEDAPPPRRRPRK